MSYTYAKRPGQRATAPRQGSLASGHMPLGAVPNSALLSMVRARPQAQIPTAEAEADRLSSSVTSGSPDAVKAEMSRRLQADLSGVRFHLDSDAASKTDGMGARAYTAGADVYFGSGGFEPSVAAHELVHTVQQGAVDGGVSTVSAPLGGIQMDPIDLKKMKFGKRAYRSDDKYQALEGLIKNYNSSGSDDDKAKLLEAAMSYVDSTSSGAKAKHKGRTSMAEDLIFQLSGEHGEQRKAADSLVHLSGTATNELDQRISQNPTNDQAKLARSGLLGGLSEMSKIIRGGKSGGSKTQYSKTLQMATTGVLSQLDAEKDTLTETGRSGTTRSIGDSGYKITTRGGCGTQDSLGTTLHEMTHAASGRLYDNTTSFLTIGQDATRDEVRARREDRAKRMTQLSKLAHESGDKQLDSYVNSVGTGRAAYGGGGKMLSTYLPGIRRQMLTKMVETEGGDTAPIKGAQSLAATDVKYKEKFGDSDADAIAAQSRAAGMNEAEIRDMKRNYTGMKQMEDAMSDQSTPRKGYDDPNAPQIHGSDTMSEYDSVINQMLADYEYSHSDRESEYYRSLKAAVLRSHVDRELEKIKKRKAGAQ